MPLVKIEMLAGKPLEFKKTVFDCVHEGLIEALEFRFGIVFRELRNMINQTGKFLKKNLKTL